MKTKQKIAILSVALIFAATFASDPVSAQGRTTSTIVPYCRHIITLVFAEDQSWCGNYVIELRDGSGKLVAPAVALNPNQVTYTVYEKLSPVFDAGPRAAFLRKLPSNTQAQCVKSLRAKPAFHPGPFEPLKTYRFMLYITIKGLED